MLHLKVVIFVLLGLFFQGCVGTPVVVEPTSTACPTPTPTPTPTPVVVKPTPDPKPSFMFIFQPEIELAERVLVKVKDADDYSNGRLWTNYADYATTVLEYYPNGSPKKFQLVVQIRIGKAEPLLSWVREIEGFAAENIADGFEITFPKSAEADIKKALQYAAPFARRGAQVTRTEARQKIKSSECEDKCECNACKDPVYESIVTIALSNCSRINGIRWQNMCLDEVEAVLPAKEKVIDKALEYLQAGQLKACAIYTKDDALAVRASRVGLTNAVDNTRMEGVYVSASQTIVEELTALSAE